MSEATVERRINNTALMDAVRTERNKIATQIGSRLMAMSMVAADYLMTVIRDPSESTHHRVRAASIVIGESRVWMDAELAERLDELEAELGTRAVTSGVS